jgi:hypothetical protein
MSLSIELKVQYYSNYVDIDNDDGNASNVVKIDVNNSGNDEIDYFSTCFVSSSTMDIINGNKNVDRKNRLLCRLHTDNMKRNVIVWIQSISNINDTAILTPPMVVQKLQLPYYGDSNIMLTTVNNRLIISNVIEIDLCKISRYDTNDDSNDDDSDVKALQRYFSIKRLLQKGDIICVGTLPVDSIYQVAATIAGMYILQNISLLVI